MILYNTVFYMVYTASFVALSVVDHLALQSIPDGLHSLPESIYYHRYDTW